MMLRFENLIIDVDEIVLADMHYPDQDSIEDWMELSLSFNGGAKAILTGDQAEMVWKVIKDEAMDCTPPDDIDYMQKLIISDRAS